MQNYVLGFTLSYTPRAAAMIVFLAIAGAASARAFASEGDEAAYERHQASKVGDYGTANSSSRMNAYIRRFDAQNSRELLHYLRTLPTPLIGSPVLCVSDLYPKIKFSHMWTVNHCVMIQFQFFVTISMGLCFEKLSKGTDGMRTTVTW